MSMLTDMQRAREVFESMRATLEISVTQQDIALGVRGSPRTCALARAAQRELLPLFPRDAIVSVHHGNVYVFVANYHCRWWLDDDGLKLMRRFDGGKRVKPHTVQLHKPGTGIS